MYLIDEPFKKEIRVMFPDDVHPLHKIVLPLPIMVSSHPRMFSKEMSMPVLVYRNVGRTGPKGIYVFRMEGVQ